MSHLHRLSIEEITEDHLILLANMCKGEYFGMTAERALTEVLNGTAQLWATSDGLVLSELVRHPAGLELFIRGFTGKSLVREMRGIVEEFKEIARERGCKWLGGAPANQRFVPFFEKLGEKMICARMAMEV